MDAEQSEQQPEIIDLFAGPGGWDVGARMIGLADPLGVELDGDACATRRAAGHRTLQGDVSALDPLEVAGGRPVEGLIVSAPCKAFSRAGKGHGSALREPLIQAIHAHDWSARPDPDPLVWLVLEIGRWTEALQPRWIACEQVPSVLPIFQAYRQVLEDWGYSAWCGNVSAESYGVPQTRARSLLIASRDRTVGCPAATHERFRKVKGQQAEHLAMLQPFVTMAQALGWTEEMRAGFARRDDTGTSEDGYRDRDWRSGDEPALAVTEKARSWQVEPVMESAMSSHVNDRTLPRTLDEPAPTVAFGHSQMRWVEPETAPDDPPEWTFERPATTVNGDPRVSAPTRAGRDPNYQPGDPAPRQQGGPGAWRRNDQGIDGGAAGGGGTLWPLERPATTIAGRDLVPDPGANGNRFNGATKSRNDGYRITLREALLLQTFPPDYPVQGTKTARFRQVGDAVPPLLAAHVLATATGRHVP